MASNMNELRQEVQLIAELPFQEFHDRRIELLKTIRNCELDSTDVNVIRMELRKLAIARDRGARKEVVDVDRLVEQKKLLKNAEEVTAILQRAEKAIQNEVSRTGEAETVLHRSKEKVELTGSKLADLGEALLRGEDVLNELKKIRERERLRVMLALVFYICVVIYIVYVRLGARLLPFSSAESIADLSDSQPTVPSLSDELPEITYDTLSDLSPTYTVHIPPKESIEDYGSKDILNDEL